MATRYFLGCFIDPEGSISTVEIVVSTYVSCMQHFPLDLALRAA